MIASHQGEAWQFTELRRIIRERHDDASGMQKTVFLMNPADRERLDDMIMSRFWPRVSASISGTGLSVMPSRGGERRQDIYDKHAEYAARELMFCLQDPQRPVASVNHAPWFFRGYIKCSVAGCMLSSDFYIYLPNSCGFKRILGLLSNPAFVGCPPEMSYGRGCQGPDHVTISFHHGSGAGWLLDSPEAASDRFEAMLRDNVRIIESVCILEQDFRSIRAFNELTRRLLAAYRAE